MNKSSDISERILQLIDDLKVNPNLFAKTLGYNRSQAIYDIINRKAKPSFDFFNKLINSEYSEHIDLIWIISGKKSKIVNIPKEKILKSNQGIPYYKNLPASAGDLVTYLKDEKPASYINLPEISDCTAVLPVFGKSMKGVVEPGDLIAVKEISTRSEFDSALPHLVITHEYRMIKYLHQDEDDASIIWAVSTNYPRIRLTAESIIKVYAIKGVIRMF